MESDNYDAFINYFQSDESPSPSKEDWFNFCIEEFLGKEERRKFFRNLYIEIDKKETTLLTRAKIQRFFLSKYLGTRKAGREILESWSKKNIKIISDNSDEWGLIIEALSTYNSDKNSYQVEGYHTLDMLINNSIEHGTNIPSLVFDYLWEKKSKDIEYNLLVSCISKCYIPLAFSKKLFQHFSPGGFNGTKFSDLDDESKSILFAATISYLNSDEDIQIDSLITYTRFIEGDWVSDEQVYTGLNKKLSQLSDEDRSKFFNIDDINAEIKNEEKLLLKIKIANTASNNDRKAYFINLFDKIEDLLPLKIEHNEFCSELSEFLVYAVLYGGKTLKEETNNFLINGLKDSNIYIIKSFYKLLELKKDNKSRLDPSSNDQINKLLSILERAGYSIEEEEALNFKLESPEPSISSASSEGRKIKEGLSNFIDDILKKINKKDCNLDLKKLTLFQECEEFVNNLELCNVNKKDIDQLLSYIKTKVTATKILEDRCLWMMHGDVSKSLEIADMKKSYSFNYMITKWLKVNLSYNQIKIDKIIKSIEKILTLGWKISDISLMIRDFLYCRPGEGLVEFLSFIINRKVNQDTVRKFFLYNIPCDDPQAGLESFLLQEKTISITSDWVLRWGSKDHEKFLNKLSRLPKRIESEFLNDGMLKSENFFHAEPQQILDALEHCCNYIGEKGEPDCLVTEAITIFKSESPNNWLKLLGQSYNKTKNDEASTEKEKYSFDELLDLMITGETFSDKMLKDEYKRQYKNIRDFYEINTNTNTKDKKLFKENLKKTQKKYIKQINKKGEAITDGDLKLVADVICAMELHRKYKIRDAQILSLLTMLNAKKDKGRLAQVLTGEGKTTTIAMLAAIKAIKGEKVDVVTTSSVLAKDGYDKNAKFYEFLELSYGNISDNTISNDLKKKYYKSQIIYGDHSSFEADYLRDRFYNLGLRCGRPFDAVIVDEVDSMLIDMRDDSTRISSEFPGMRHLDPALVLIYRNVEQASVSLHNIGGKLYSIKVTMEGDGQNSKAESKDSKLQTSKTSEASEEKESQNYSSKSVKGSDRDDPTYYNILSCIFDNLPEKLKEDLKIGNKKQFLSEETHLRLFEKYASEIKHKSDQLTDEQFNDLKIIFNSPVGKIDLLCRIFQVRLDVYCFTEEGLSIDPNWCNSSSQVGLGDDTPGAKSIKMLSTQSGFFALEETSWEDKRKKIAENILRIVVPSSSDKLIDEPNNRKKTKETSSELGSDVNKETEITKEKEQIRSETYLAIPEHLYIYFKNQINNFIDSAYFALNRSHENKDFVIKEDSDKKKVIAPVDYTNTGVIQDQVKWSDGLHLFLQIKHKLRINSEQLTTNFLSNVTFFKFFKHKIFGFTGTMGSEAEIKFVSGNDKKPGLYNVDTVAVPPYKKVLRQKLPDLFIESYEEWSNLIIDNALIEVKKERPVLIICDTGEKALLLNKLLMLKNNKLSIRLYTRDDIDEEKNAIEEELKPGEIVIATNLAGRGTDLLLNDKSKENGGLHVLLSFLPKNIRVQLQAEGRAARAGQPGTTQMIVNVEEAILNHLESCKDPENFSIKKPSQLLELRDESEKNSYIEAENRIKIIAFEHSLFEKFCSFMAKHGLLRDFQDLDDDQKCKRAELEQRWGFFYSEVQKRFVRSSEGFDAISKDIIKRFKAEFEDKKFDSIDFVKNPFHLTIYGKYLIEKGDIDNAIEIFTKAIQLDPIFSMTAYYNRAYCYLKKNEDNKDKDYKNEAITDLNEAMRLIKTYHEPELLMLGSLTGTNVQECKKSDPLSPVTSEVASLFSPGMSYKLRPVAKDGNCFFSSVSIALKAAGGAHYSAFELREKAANYIATNHDRYAPFLSNDIDGYLLEMRKSGTWAEGPILNALAEALQLKIHIADIVGTNLSTPKLYTLGENSQSNTTQLHLQRSGPDGHEHYDAIILQEADSDSDLDSDNRKKSDTDLVKQIKGKLAILSRYTTCIEESLKKIGEIQGDLVVSFKDKKEANESSGSSPYAEEPDDIFFEGAAGIISVSQAPFPWWSVIAVFALGLAQIVGSFILAPVCPNFAMGLLLEGVTDLYTATQACITGSFSWRDYIKNKLISIVVSVLAAGFCAVATKIGRGLSSVGNFLNRVFPKASSLIKSGYNKAKLVYQSTQNLYSKAVSTVSGAIRKITSPISKFIKNIAKVVKDKFSKVFSKSFAGGASKKIVKDEYLRQSARMVMAQKLKQELVKKAFTMGSMYLIDHHIMSNICSEIQKSLEKNIYDSLKSKIIDCVEFFKHFLILLRPSLESKQNLSNIRGEAYDILHDKTNEYSTGSLITRSSFTIFRDLTKVLPSKIKKTGSFLSEAVVAGGLVISLMSKIYETVTFVTLKDVFTTDLFKKIQKMTKGKQDELKEIDEDEQNKTKQQVDILIRDWSGSIASYMTSSISNTFINPVLSKFNNDVIGAVNQKNDAKVAGKFSEVKAQLRAQSATRYLGINASNDSKPVKLNDPDYILLKSRADSLCADRPFDTLDIPAINHYLCQESSQPIVFSVYQTINGKMVHIADYGPRGGKVIHLHYEKASDNLSPGHCRALDLDPITQKLRFADSNEGSVGTNNCFTSIIAGHLNLENTIENMKILREGIASSTMRISCSLVCDDSYTKAHKYDNSRILAGGSSILMPSGAQSTENFEKHRKIWNEKFNEFIEKKEKFFREGFKVDINDPIEVERLQNKLKVMKIEDLRTLLSKSGFDELYKPQHLRDEELSSNGTSKNSGNDELAQTSEMARYVIFDASRTQEQIKIDPVKLTDIFYHIRIPTEEFIWVYDNGKVSGHPGAVRVQAPNGEFSEISKGSYKIHQQRLALLKNNLDSPSKALSAILTYTINTIAGMRVCEDGRLEFKDGNDVFTTTGHNMNNREHAMEILTKIQAKKDIAKVILSVHEGRNVSDGISENGSVSPIKMRRENVVDLAEELQKARDISCERFFELAGHYLKEPHFKKLETKQKFPSRKPSRRQNAANSAPTLFSQPPRSRVRRDMGDLPGDRINKDTPNAKRAKKV